MMKIFTNFISSIMLAVLLTAIAIFSIQNIQLVSLQFIVWKSIKIPVGVLLTLCIGGGIILGSLLPVLWQRRQANY